MKYYITTSQQYFKKYIDKFLIKETHGWLKTLRFFWLVALVVITLGISLVLYVDPIPPKSVSLAIGQEGSSYENISLDFESIFKKNGIKLNLVPTSGLGHGLEKLNNAKSDVAASFMTAGIASVNQYPNLVSLGSVQYAPVWIFYRGADVKTNDPFEYFSNKKINIGPSGNATNELFKKFYGLNQNKMPSGNNFSEYSFKESAEKLIAGKLDAVFIVDNYQSDIVQTLLGTKDIKIVNFPLADAYLKKLPFLHKLVIPRGSINLDSVHPSEDITILASTTTLLIEKGTHPAIQWSFLLAAKHFGSSENTFFTKPGYFPKNLDQGFPLSDIAERFYDHGVPTVFGYLPFWLASLIENIWAYLLAFFVVIFPLYKFFAKVRQFPTVHLMNQMFINFRELDEAVELARNKEDLIEISKVADLYEREISENWIYSTNARFYFNLKNALAAVRREVENKMTKL